MGTVCEKLEGYQVNSGVAAGATAGKESRRALEGHSKGANRRALSKPKVWSQDGNTRCCLRVRVSSGKHSTEWTHLDIFSGLTFERLPPWPPFGAHVDMYNLSCPVLASLPILSPLGFVGRAPLMAPGGHVTQAN